MYTLKTNSSFDSAHFLAGYQGKCSNIHGHRWKVEIEVGSDSLEKEGNERGMIMDFSELKHALAELTDDLDHSLIIEKGSLKKELLNALLEEKFRIIEVAFRPTAENFARYFYERMQSKGYKVVVSTVYETPNNCASYRE